MESYKTLARFYDELATENDYLDYYNFIRGELASRNVKTVLDLACGTGEFSLRLARDGYGVFASDISEEMLTVADNKAGKNGVHIQFTRQDMRSFQVNTPVDSVISCFDSYNYLQSINDVASSFRCVNKALRNGGIFIFDINSKWKFEHIYGENTFVLESENTFCVWENYYNTKTKVCRFYLNIFEHDGNNTYKRLYEEQKEKCYSISSITRELKKAGFSEIEVYGGINKKVADEHRDERIYFIAKKTESGENNG